MSTVACTHRVNDSSTYSYLPTSDLTSTNLSTPTYHCTNDLTSVDLWTPIYCCISALTSVDLWTPTYHCTSDICMDSKQQMEKREKEKVLEGARGGGRGRGKLRLRKRRMWSERKGLGKRWGKRTRLGNRRWGKRTSKTKTVRGRRRRKRRNRIRRGRGGVRGKRGKKRRWRWWGRRDEEKKRGKISFLAHLSLQTQTVSTDQGWLDIIGRRRNRRGGKRTEEMKQRKRKEEMKQRKEEEIKQRKRKEEMKQRKRKEKKKARGSKSQFLTIWHAANRPWCSHHPTLRPGCSRWWPGPACSTDHTEYHIWPHRISHLTIQMTRPLLAVMCWCPAFQRTEHRTPTHQNGKLINHLHFHFSSSNCCFVT